MSIFQFSAEYLAVSSLLAWKVLSNLKKKNLFHILPIPTEHERSCFQNPKNSWMLNFRVHIALIKKRTSKCTSLQWSVSVLYTYNFKGRPSWASIKVKRSSDSWRTESAPMIYNEFITCFHESWIYDKVDIFTIQTGYKKYSRSSQTTVIDIKMTA